MNLSEFDWDFENITHIARHGVTPEEAESVFAGPVLDLGYEIKQGELRYIEAGCTSSGRILQVITTERGHRNRIITAYDPDRSVIARYFAALGDREMLPEMPKFETEAEEASWWYEQRHNIAAELERLKPDLGPSPSLLRLAKLRGTTVEELQEKLRSQASGAQPMHLPRSA
jgi:uncharacterized DUF497 family protein